jgi:hypothetical protein
MKKEQDYIRDIVEMHPMVRLSSKFLSFAGFPGTMAGIYALPPAILPEITHFFCNVTLKHKALFTKNELQSKQHKCSKHFFETF